MPTKEELDRELAEYLARQRKAENDGFTMRAMHETMKSLDGRYAEHERKDDARHSDVIAMVRGLETRISLNEHVTNSLKSDVGELKPAIRASMDSIHDITEQGLEEKLAEAKAKNKETLDIIKQVAIYTACAVIGVVVTYFAMRFGLAH